MPIFKQHAQQFLNLLPTHKTSISEKLYVFLALIVNSQICIFSIQVTSQHIQV